MAPVITVKRQGPDVTAQSAGIGLFREATSLGISVSQLLERMDPTDEYEARDRGLDAFERVLKASGIVINPLHDRGVQASTWEEATNTPEKRALMHEFCARVYRQVSAPTLHPPTAQVRSLLLSGDVPLNSIANQYSDDLTPRARRIKPALPINRLVATTTSITGDAVRTLYITDDIGTDAYRMKRVAEGTNIPTTTLVSGEHYVRLYKYGRALRSTYEQLRRLPLDRIAFIIGRMALQAEADKVANVIGVIVAGDGNANTAAATMTLTSLDSGAIAGTLTLKGWIFGQLEFTAAYNPDTVIAQKPGIGQLMLLPVNTVNGTPLAMQSASPFGAIQPINDQLANGIGYGVSSDAPALSLVMFDSESAVERFTEIGGNVSEVETFIQNQTSMLTLTEVEGYGVIDPYASRVLNING